MSGSGGMNEAVETEQKAYRLGRRGMKWLKESEIEKICPLNIEERLSCLAWDLWGSTGQCWGNSWDDVEIGDCFLFLVASCYS